MDLRINPIILYYILKKHYIFSVLFVLNSDYPNKSIYNVYLRIL